MSILRIFPKAKKSANGIRTYDGEFWIYFVGFLILVLIILCLPIWLTEKTWIPLSVSKANEIGDAIGGTLGPFVALLAAALTFLAFWVQFKANQQQRHDIRIERFENKFFEMLSLHNDTVRDIDIASRHSGRKAFVYLFDEFRFTYRIIENEFYVWNSKAETDNAIPHLNYTKETLAELAYIMFFFGVGELSNKATLHIHKVHTPFYVLVKNILQGLQFKYRKNSGHGKYVKIVYSIYPAIDTEINYIPFEGHVSKLGHYYRHLYQMVKFIDREESLDDKYSFMRTLRAQLSNHEQLLLYYNSFFIDKWWEEGLFLSSRIIKNIPLYLTDFGPDPEVKFKEAIKKINPSMPDDLLKKEMSKHLEWYVSEAIATS